ncbi:ankyrin repeat and SAM domain-containing protein 6-like isoform X2 [Schistocerca americana]|uniref:ankyrin repeat and SAM domain-containing protein 6-like isoform X2 n=1 Tax=Schistocerca americana TaxID=7009 RepID=UPI001F4F2EF8|nr:ankyrin repeat and SAM domain-containing protein 6-like isoform X2 [Schistocerca americana]
MIYRTSIWLIYILMAVVRATDFSDPESNTTEYVPEATVDRLRTDDPQSPPTASPQEVTDTAAMELEPATETSTPATADGETTATAQPHGNCSEQNRTAATAAPLPPLCEIPPPDDPDVSRLRTLPADMNSRGLLQSATRGLMEEVQVLLGAGADVGYRGWTMWTALHYAAKQGHTDIVRCLIGNGAEVDARTDVRQTPLHLAAWKAMRQWCGCWRRPRPTSMPRISGVGRLCTGRHPTATQRRRRRCWMQGPIGTPRRTQGTLRWT